MMNFNQSWGDPKNLYHSSVLALRLKLSHKLLSRACQLLDKHGAHRRLFIICFPRDESRKFRFRVRGGTPFLFLKRTIHDRFYAALTITVRDDWDLRLKRE